MPAAFSWANLVDAGTVTTDSEASTLPVENVQDRQVQRPWRSLSATAYLDVDFGSSVSLQVLALRFDRLSAAFPISGDTVSHALSTVSAGATDVYGPGAVAHGVEAGIGYHVTVLSAAVSARYWRCTFDFSTLAAAQSTTYFDVGRAWAGALWTPTRTLDYGSQRTISDLTLRTSSPRSGAAFLTRSDIVRGARLDLNYLSTADAQTIEAYTQAARSYAEVMWIEQPTGASPHPARGSLIGTLGASQALTRASFVTHRLPIILTETM